MEEDIEPQRSFAYPRRRVVADRLGLVLYPAFLVGVISATSVARHQISLSAIVIGVGLLVGAFALAVPMRAWCVREVVVSDWGVEATNFFGGHRSSTWEAIQGWRLLRPAMRPRSRVMRIAFDDGTKLAVVCDLPGCEELQHEVERHVGPGGGGRPRTWWERVLVAPHIEDQYTSRFAATTSVWASHISDRRLVASSKAR